MTLKPLSKREYSVLSHFAEKSMMGPNDFDSAHEYNLQADIAVELFQRGLLLSEMDEPFRRNRGRSDFNYLEVGILRLSPSAIRILKCSYPMHMSLVVLLWLVTSGATLSLIGIAVSL